MSYNKISTSNMNISFLNESNNSSFNIIDDSKKNSNAKKLSKSSISNNLNIDDKVNNRANSTNKDFKNKEYFKGLYSIINYSFKDENLVREALTRQSAIGERNPDASEKNYQRFEFFGDSLLNFIITELVFEVFPDRTEEYLTPFRSDIVKNDTLAKLAQDKNLGNFLILGKGEEKQKSRYNKHILADIVEALIAAVYRDTGKDYVLTRSITLKLFQKTIMELFKKKSENDIPKLKKFFKEYFILNNGEKCEFKDEELIVEDDLTDKNECFPQKRKSDDDIGKNKDIKTTTKNKNSKKTNKTNKTDKAHNLAKDQKNNLNIKNEDKKKYIDLKNSHKNKLPDDIGNNSTSSCENNILPNIGLQINNHQNMLILLDDLVRCLNHDLIKENSILNIEYYTDALSQSSSFEFYIEYAVRIIHEISIENTKLLDYSLLLKKVNFEEKLNNLQTKELFSSTNFIMSLSFLDNFQGSLTDLDTGKLFYYKCYELYLYGYFSDVNHQIDYCLNSLKKVMNSYNEKEKNEAKNFYAKALIIKINSKIKFNEDKINMDKFKEKYEPSLNNINSKLYKKGILDISKYELEEIEELIKDKLFNEDLEIKFYYIALKINYLYYEYQNSNSLLKNTDAIEEEIKNMELVIFSISINIGISLNNSKKDNEKKIKQMPINNKLILYLYAEIKIIEAKIKNRKIFTFEKMEILKKEIFKYNSHFNINCGVLYNDIIFFPIKLFELENYIAEWSNDNLEHLLGFSKIFEELEKIIQHNFGIFSGYFEKIYYKVNKLRENLIHADEDEDNDEN